MFVTVLSAEVNHEHLDPAICGNLYEVSHIWTVRGWIWRWSGDCCQVIAVQRRTCAAASPARLLRVWPDTNSAGEYKMVVRDLGARHLGRSAAMKRNVL